MSNPTTWVCGGCHGIVHGTRRFSLATSIANHKTDMPVTAGIRGDHMKPARMVKAAVATAALTACTPSQVAQWKEWYDQDPEAATAFANQPEVQASLRNDQPNESANVICFNSVGPPCLV